MSDIPTNTGYIKRLNGDESAVRWSPKVETVEGKQCFSMQVQNGGLFVQADVYDQAMSALLELRRLLYKADRSVIWEQAAPHLGRGFQEEVEAALGITDGNAE